MWLVELTACCRELRVERTEDRGLDEVFVVLLFVIVTVRCEEYVD